MKILSCLFAVVCASCAVGCGTPAANRAPTPSTAAAAPNHEFSVLHRQYTNRFHAAMVRDAEQLSEKEILAEAARLWGEVFDPHEDVMRRRAAEIVASLDPSPSILMSEYAVLAETRADACEAPTGGPLKHFAWNPVTVAQRSLDQWLARILHTPSLAKRSLLVTSAPPAWEVTDRHMDHPELVQRMGPLVFVAELSRAGAYYRVDRLMWLRPKSMGPLALPPEPSSSTIGRPATASSK